MFHVATSPVVAGAWAEGQELHLYGVIYDLADGHLRKLAGPISGDDGEQQLLRLRYQLPCLCSSGGLARVATKIFNRISTSAAVITLL